MNQAVNIPINEPVNSLRLETGMEPGEVSRAERAFFEKSISVSTAGGEKMPNGDPPLMVLWGSDEDAT